MSAIIAFYVLLFWGVLTIWVPDRWAWSLFQTGIFLLAGWRVAKLRAFRLTGPAAILAAAAGWPLLQLAVHRTVHRGETWLAALNWWTFLVVFLLAADLCSEPGERRRLLRAIAFGGMALAALSLAQYFTSPDKIFFLFPSGFQEGVLGPFVNRNQYAAWVELTLPVALYLAATERRAAVYGVAGAILLGSVIAGASRAGSALCVAESIAVALTLTARRATPGKTVALRALQFGLLSTLAVGVVGGQVLRDRVFARSDEALRIDALRASLHMVRDRPWIGSGLGTWPEMYPQYAGLDMGVVVNQAHNDWAQWAVEGGLPFLALMMVFAGLLAKPAFRSIYGLGITAFLLHALVDYPMQQRPALAVWFFAVAGAAHARNGVSRGGIE